MRRPILACVEIVLTAAVGVVPAAVEVVPAASATGLAYSHLLVDAQEWWLYPSRATVPAGTVAVELWNRGEDPHDTQIRRVNKRGQMIGSILGRVSLTAPGKIGQATWHLRAGKYELYCSLPGHMKLGMEARLTVTR